MRRLRFLVHSSLVSALVLFLVGVPTAIASERDLTAPLTAETQAALTPAEVLQLLKDGNERFLNGQALERDFLSQVRMTSEGQYPMASILGCIDSRVPHEIVFDKGVGDIFSARIAGNFVNADILGSLEFATAVAGSKVVVVLGHSECGAIKGACDNVELGNLTSTLANLAPAVYAVTDVPGERTSKNKPFVEKVAHQNVDMTVQNILDRSPVMRRLVAEGKLMIVGAMHDVRTGKVEFMDPVTSVED
ncbi:MAG: carbonic anhydrase [Acidobacteria bacterium]|nr:MAG: carbonic anhydrase [Acidobacteriota bacterium]REK03256.1 MAG: carbonic anhydrase [Acidobacteriota bacterium]